MARDSHCMSGALTHALFSPLTIAPTTRIRDSRTMPQHWRRLISLRASEVMTDEN